LEGARMKKVTTRHDDTYIELKVIRTKVKQLVKKLKDAEGKIVGEKPYEKFIKEQRVRHTFYKSELMPITETMTSKDELAKSRCVVYSSRTNNYYLVDMSYENLRDLIMDKPPLRGIGFKKQEL
jgi:hypothetical protein